MDYPIHIYIIYGTVYFVFRGQRSKFLMMNIVFILENSADPDEKLHDAAFPLGHHRC